MLKNAPKVGQRIIRSVAGIALCFIVYILRGREGIPYYAALAVLQCVQPNNISMVKIAKQQVAGTLIGAVWGFIFLQIEVDFSHDSLAHYLFLSVMCGVVIYSTVLLKQTNVSNFSCVVFLTLIVFHITDANPLSHVFNRAVDTLIGIAIALFVNIVHLPREKRKHILFVSGLDGVLLGRNSSLTPYAKVELNRLIDDGAQFTISTMRTPAAIIETASQINFNLPIIAMDGAVLYDMENNSYLQTISIPQQEAVDVLKMLQQFETCVFSNAVIDDVLVIYYNELHNDAERDIYQKMRKSPYRNYLKHPLPQDADVAYFMLINPTEKTEQIYAALVECGYAQTYKIHKYESSDYQGYTYLKIYHKAATRTNMLVHLKQRLGIESSITFGNIPGESDVLITDNTGDGVVRELKNQYEPVKFF